MEGYIIPLYNFELEESIKELDLGNEKILRIEPNDSNGQIYMRPIGSSELSIVHKLPGYIIKTERQTGWKPRRILDRVLTVFKLFKEGTVTSKLVLNENWGLEDFVPHYTPWSTTQPTQFVMTGDEVTLFKKHWEKYQDVDIFNYAINNFHIAVYNPYDKYQLANYVQALEVLFVPDLENVTKTVARGRIAKHQTITMNFKKRGSQILHRRLNYIKIEDIEHKLEYFYNYRSAIVHSKKNKFDELRKITEIRDTFLELRMYCREAIKFFHEHDCISDEDKRVEMMESMLKS